MSKVGVNGNINYRFPVLKNSISMSWGVGGVWECKLYRKPWCSPSNMVMVSCSLHFKNTSSMEFSPLGDVNRYPFRGFWRFWPIPKLELLNKYSLRHPWGESTSSCREKLCRLAQKVSRANTLTFTKNQNHEGEIT